ncbi:MAG: DUF1552 domain-containing protein, partial [Rhodospirillaceae bacterium]|nr:DUF1552 domain-containing protein [Rhodospirillaceae bacterium]
LQPLAAFKDKINVFSGFKVFLDGKANGVHFSGCQGTLTGSVPAGGPGNQVGISPSIDTLIAEVIGTRTRFRSLEAACAGNAIHSQSRRTGSVVNPAEVSPAAMYTRIFGPEFTDPNAATFAPDPAVMVRQSALSVVGNERQSFTRRLGASDKARLDEYFTSLRELEKQVDMQLQKPAPLEACKVPAATDLAVIGTEVATVRENNRVFSKLLAHALACGQTNVINIAFADATSSLRKVGGTHTHHESTHEEPIDPVAGYQLQVAWYYDQIMSSYAETMAILDGIKEGDRTLLDRTVLMATTDISYAKLHGLENLPVITVGGANGRLKTGLHISAKGDPTARVGLTLQQALGVPVSTWGTESNQTSKTITEVIA